MTATMIAIVQDRYGAPADVLAVREVPRPVVAPDEVLVRVAAASVHVDVWHAVTGTPYVIRLLWAGTRRPKVRTPGLDLAGDVVAVGSLVTRFKAGDAVFGESLRGLSVGNGGTFAQFATVPEANLAAKPPHVTYAQAASAATSGGIALMTLRTFGRIEPGQSVLINGAGGGVGSIAIQLCKAAGARVTAVDHRGKIDVMRALGADEVIDYTAGDWTTRSLRHDYIFDVVSNLAPAQWSRLLTPSGLYWRVSHDQFGAVGTRAFGSLPAMFALMARTPFDRRLPKLGFSPPGKGAIIEELRQALADGSLSPIVSRTFSLGQAAAAFQCLREGSVPGRIVIEPHA
jgi:NADPH:quinone reductase-like Zn-dependent oxidoreductase